MAKLCGTWKMEKSENFDKYMEAVGVGFALRKMGNLTKPNQIITKEGDNWCIQTKSSVKNTEIKFVLGQEFDETTADGRKVKTTASSDSDSKLVLQQSGDPESTITRVLQDENNMLLTLVAKGVTCQRYYKRDT